MNKASKGSYGLTGIIGFAIVAAIGTQKGFGMGFFSEEACFFTGFEGVLLNDGKPLANTTLKLSVIASQGSNVQEINKEFTTDLDGGFTIDSIYGKQKTKTLNELVVNSKITVLHDNKETKLWSSGKVNGEKNYEFGGIPPGIVSCDLVTDYKRVNPNVAVLTSCRWENR